MQEAGFGLTEAAFNGQNDARYAQDNALLVRFYREPVEDREASEREGRPIFKDQEFVEIKTPGPGGDVHVEKVSRMNIDRFPEHYRRFKARMEGDQQISGTLLEEWPMITRSKVEELKFFSIRTVEQLAEMSDGAAQGMMGMQVLRDKANEFLNHATSNEELAKQLKEANERLAALEAQNEKPAPKRRGRKPKAKTEIEPLGALEV